MTTITCVQNPEGQLTEANFGNDDETMGRLQDMGTPAGGLAEADIVRQNQASFFLFFFFLFFCLPLATALALLLTLHLTLLLALLLPLALVLTVSDFQRYCTM